MTQLDNSESLAPALSGLVEIRRDALVSARAEVLERHPALLAAAVAKMHPPQPSDATLPTPAKRWPSDALGKLASSSASPATLSGCGHL